MKIKINEAAKISGVTVRTLQYYDKIGLLKPDEITTSGYRIYGEEDLLKLQQILLLRELDFSLKEIMAIMEDPKYSRNEALKNQRVMLLKKKERIDSIIKLIDRELKGDNEMSFKEFDMSEIEKCKKEYAEEAKHRWGNTDAYKESIQKTGSYDKERWEQMNRESQEIFKKFAALVGSDPTSDEAKALVKEWQNYISANFYKCTDEILKGLGLMYSQDERFKNNIDSCGPGTAEFMSAAIAAY